MNANGTITELMSGKCMDVAQYSLDPGAQVWQYHCTGAANQQWKLVPVTGGYNIVGVQSGLCLDAGTSLPPCTTQPGSGMPWCNPALDWDTRVSNLVANIADTDKPGLFDTTSSGVGSLMIGAYQWCVQPPALLPPQRNAHRCLARVAGGARRCMAWHTRPASPSAAICRVPPASPSPRTRP